MSKLSKFKTYISPIEAAELLSRLINETVSVEDIQRLHKLGWLNAHFNCSCTLVRLKLEFAEEAKDRASVANLSYFMTEDEDCGLCFAIDLPLCEITVNRNSSSLAVMDAEHNFYALRDNDTNQYISETGDNYPSFEDAGLYPQQIYEIAEMANNDLPLDEPEVKIIENKSCLSEIAIFNFVPHSHQNLPSPLAIETLPQSESPSYVLAVAALVEIITEGGKKNYNQSSLIDEITENYELRGLSKSNLEKMFSQANRKLSEAKAAKG